MAIKVGINGFGRIGRLVFRVLAARPKEFEVVGINDLTNNKMLATLLKYDSNHGRFNGTVEHDENNLTVNGKKIRALSEPDPAKLPWGELGAAIVVESTGFFTARSTDKKPGYDTHLAAGAKKVVLSAPAKDGADITCVLGVNDDKLSASHNCVSNASCTTNCLAPVAKVLHDSFGIEKGLMTTVHAYTNDQNVQDQPRKDGNEYRMRAAATNIIPSTTGAASAIGLVIPELQGKLTGFALRVPVSTGSVVDLNAVLKKNVTKEEIHAAIKAAAAGPMKGILEYTDDAIVSTDIIGHSASSLFVGDWTEVIGGNLVKVVSWYDNEWGYSCRTVDLISKLGAML
jgi:glyceraldehyde 3-phosphate dehydrogenase